MNRYEYNDHIIEVYIESADSPNDYSPTYFSGDENDYQVCHHGISVFQNGIVKASCLLIGSGGATGLQENSSLIQENRLVVCCCDYFLYQIAHTTTELEAKSGSGYLFSNIALNEDFIVHGEVEISRIDRNGYIKWSFSGHDIFVSLDENISFELLSDHILLHDFIGNRYLLDFDG